MRLRALCKMNPSDTRNIFYRRSGCSGSFVDACLYEACASMEERFGDTAKDVKLLQEGLRARAAPAVRLHCVLWRLLPSPPPAGHGTVVKLAGALAAASGSALRAEPRELLRGVVQEVPAAPERDCGQGCDASPMARKLPQESRHHTLPAVATPNRTPSVLS